MTKKKEDQEKVTDQENTEQVTQEIAEKEKPLTISEYKIRLMKAFQKRTNPVTPATAMKIINEVDTKK